MCGLSKRKECRIELSRSRKISRAQNEVECSMQLHGCISHELN